MTQKKSDKLGMSFGTARARLERDLVYKFAIEAGHKCHRCGGDMDRETFSVEHKAPWMRAADPKAAFFDLSNIAFSHTRCNQLEMAERRRRFDSPRECQIAYRPVKAAKMRERYTTESRQEKYQRTGH